MKRVFTNRMNQIIIIPTIGILWNIEGVMISFAWLNVGCSVLIFNRKED